MGLLHKNFHPHISILALSVKVNLISEVYYFLRKKPISKTIMSLTAAGVMEILEIQHLLAMRKSAVPVVLKGRSKIKQVVVLQLRAVMSIFLVLFSGIGGLGFNWPYREVSQICNDGCM